MPNRAEICLADALFNLQRDSAMYNKQDARPGHSHFLGLPEVLISFSVTLSHAVPRYWISCRGVSPTNQGVCISSWSCTRSSLLIGRPATAGNRTPVCGVGGENVTICCFLTHENSNVEPWGGLLNQCCCPVQCSSSYRNTQHLYQYILHSDETHHRIRLQSTERWKFLQVSSL